MNDWIRINLTRESVCAGDDIDAPHEKTMKMYPDESIDKVVRKIIDTNYLPSIFGGKATWLMKANGINIAIIAEQWSKPRYFLNQPGPLSEFTKEEKLDITIDYYVQNDPDYIYEEIASGKHPKRW